MVGEKPAESDVKLPFDALRQAAILGHCVDDRAFFLTCYGKMQPSWFVDVRLGRLYQCLCTWFETNKNHPSPADLRGASAIMAEAAPERTQLQSTLDKARLAATELYLPNLQRELNEWYKTRLLVEGIEKAKGLYNSSNFTAAINTFVKQADVIRLSDFADDGEVSFERPETYLSEAEQSYQGALTMGLSLLDASLRPDGQPLPSLLRGDMTVLMAPSNVGKTSALITTLAHNLRNNRHILFLTHEGRSDDIREKILMSLLKWTRPQLYENFKKPGKLSAILARTVLCKRNLVYVPYNHAGQMHVESVVGLIRRKIEEHYAKTGHGFDMIVDDYPAKLTSQLGRSGNLAKRNLDAIVYDCFVQLALEYKMHALVAIQTNRQGSKDNRAAERLLIMEDVAECYDVMMMATNVFTMNRDLRAQNANRLTFFEAKSRSSETGRAIVARTNYAACITHSDQLGGTYYRGDSTHTDQIDALMTKYNGREIPQNELCFASTGGE